MACEFIEVCPSKTEGCANKSKHGFSSLCVPFILNAYANLKSHSGGAYLKLKDFLRTKTKVGDIVQVRTSGYPIALILVDSEDNFFDGLNQRILDFTVKEVSSEQIDGFVNPVTVVEV